jgi:hypothetical protein
VGLDLLCLQIEMALENEQEQVARAGVEESLLHASDDPRLLAAKSRLLAREGDLPAARRMYDFVCARLKKSCSSEVEIPPLWLAEAAFEAQQWKESMEMFDRYAAAHTASARGQMRHGTCPRASRRKIPPV